MSDYCHTTWTGKTRCDDYTFLHMCKLEKPHSGKHRCFCGIQAGS